MSRNCAECMSTLKNEDPNATYGIFRPCICAELNNNLLMWSVLTYGAGFINWWVYENECGYCQSHANILLNDEYYQDHIVDVNTLYKIVNANLNIIHEKNANGATIFTMIDDIIVFIKDTIKTYETPHQMNHALCDAIITGQRHINDLHDFRLWLNVLP